MMVVWQNVQHQNSPGQTVSLSTLASYGQSLFTTIVLIELTLVLLAAPAATAGAICLDKARGTLDHMLATDLSNGEIILGKLGVRLVPVLGLIACVLPLAALAGLLGGIDPTALFGSFLTAIACAFLGCSLALTLSVGGRKTHEVLMLTYLILILWVSSPVVMGLLTSSLFGAVPWSSPILWEWVMWSNPYYLVFAPYMSLGKISMTTYFGFLGVCLCLSGLFMVVATHRIRKVAMKQAGQAAARPRRGQFVLRLPHPAWLPRLLAPSLDGNPVLWREWHRSRPSRFMGFVWFLYTALGVLWTAVALKVLNAAPGNTEVIVAMNTFQVAVGLLLLSVTTATSLAEERGVHGSLDVLLSTPLSTFSILVGKWRGAFRLVPHVLVWPALMTGFLVLESGNWISYLLLLGLILAYSAGITSLGLALATWVSRPGRAIALCVSAYVVFSFGWFFLVALVFNRDRVGQPLAMGSPLYGTVLATSAVVAGERHFLDAHGKFAAGVGAVLWILIHSGVAAVLFVAVAATFDRCLGRMPETGEDAIADPGKKHTLRLQSDLSEWLADSSAELSEPV